MMGVGRAEVRDPVDVLVHEAVGVVGHHLLVPLPRLRRQLHLNQLDQLDQLDDAVASGDAIGLTQTVPCRLAIAPPREALRQVPR
jgi:hypothetical protein